MATHTDTPTTFLTPKKLSARWEVTTMTLRRWRRQGKLVAHHIGRGVRFALADVVRLEAEGRVGVPQAHEKEESQS